MLSLLFRILVVNNYQINTGPKIETSAHTFKSILKMCERKGVIAGAFDLIIIHPTFHVYPAWQVHAIDHVRKRDKLALVYTFYVAASLQVEYNYNELMTFLENKSIF